MGERLVMASSIMLCSFTDIEESGQGVDAYSASLPASILVGFCFFETVACWSAMI
jgi:hypothetical protein